MHGKRLAAAWLAVWDFALAVRKEEEDEAFGSFAPDGVGTVDVSSVNAVVELLLEGCPDGTEQQLALGTNRVPFLLVEFGEIGNRETDGFDGGAEGGVQKGGIELDTDADVVEPSAGGEVEMVGGDQPRGIGIGEDAVDAGAFSHVLVYA